MPPNAPRSDTDSLAASGTHASVAKPAHRPAPNDILAETRCRLGQLTELRPSCELIAALLSNGHLALALLCAGDGIVPSSALRRAAQMYEEKGWVFLAARAYGAAGDTAAVKRISDELRAEGLVYDAAELARTAELSADGIPTADE